MFSTKLARLANQYPMLRTALAPAILLRRRLRYVDQTEINDVISNFARLMVEDPMLRVDEFQGQFAMSASSALFRRIIQNGEYEPVLTRHCLEMLNPDRDALDIGANIGFHSVLLAKNLKGGKVLAVEPTRNALRRLRRNIDLNDVGERVSVFEGVASNAPGMLEIKTIEGREEYSSLGVMGHPSISGISFRTERVAASTVDDLVAMHQLDPGFMKIDVEGAEHLVFEGARTTLGKHRPVILSELSDDLLRQNGSSAADVVRFIEGFDYTVIDPLHPDTPPGYQSFGDILCTPR